MADLLFWFYTEGDEKGDLELELSVIDDFTDEGLCARYHFQHESILFITNLVTGDISRTLDSITPYRRSIKF